MREHYRAIFISNRKEVGQIIGIQRYLGIYYNVINVIIMSLNRRSDLVKFI